LPSSITGKPAFDLTVKGISVTHQPDVQIEILYKSALTPVGSFVYVVMTRPSLQDAPSIVISVLIPAIDLGSATSFNFKSVLLESYQGGLVPPPLAFQNLSHVTKLNCTATRAMF
jgi:hypothetical protein